MGAWEITRKDLKLLIRDRRALAILVLLPIVFISILGLTTGKLLGWKDDNQVLKVDVVIESDPEGVARDVVQVLKQREGLRPVVVSSTELARRHLDDREVSAVVIFGKHFDQRIDELRIDDILDAQSGALKQGPAALDMTVETRVSAFGIKSITEQLVLATTLQVVAPRVARKNKLIDRLLSRRAKARDTKPSEPASAAAGTAVADQASATQSASSGQAASSGNPVYEVLVPAFTVMFAFFLVNIMARSFLSERETGTLQRLRMAPIRRDQLLLGKTIPFLIISLAQSVLLFLFGKLLFGMSWGPDPTLLVPIIFCTSVAATGLGLLVATVVRTDSQVSAYANFLVITMAGISGCFMPRDWLPDLMKKISLVTPHAWALIAYDQALTTRIPNLDVIYQCCAMLLIFGAVYFAIGSWRFRTLV